MDFERLISPKETLVKPWWEAIFGQERTLSPHRRQPGIATVKLELDSEARLKERTFVIPERRS